MYGSLMVGNVPSLPISLQVATFIRKNAKKQTTRFAGSLEIGSKLKIPVKLFTKVHVWVDMTDGGTYMSWCGWWWYMYDWWRYMYELIWLMVVSCPLVGGWSTEWRMSVWQVTHGRVTLCAPLQRLWTPPYLSKSLFLQCINESWGHCSIFMCVRCLGSCTGGCLSVTSETWSGSGRDVNWIWEILTL